MNPEVDFFDKVEKTVWHQDLQRSLLHLVGVGSEDTVLDVGCGAGRFSILLGQRAKMVIGVDFRAEMVRLATANCETSGMSNVHFQSSDFASLPFQDKTFDIVTALNAFFRTRHPEAVVQSLLRVCKPGGMVIVANPTSDCHPWNMNRFCVRNEMRGFERDSLESFAKASAMRGGDILARLDAWIDDYSGTLVENLYMMDGMVRVKRMMRTHE